MRQVWGPYGHRVLHHNPRDGWGTGLKLRFVRAFSRNRNGYIIDDGLVTMQPFMLSGSIHEPTYLRRDIVAHVCHGIKYLIIEIDDGGLSHLTFIK